MRRLRQWLIRLTTSMTRRHDDTRLREEIDDHVAFETEANVRRGFAPAEARRRALLTFGSIATFKETYRDQQGVPPLEHLLQDVRIALRRMWKTPGFTAAAVVTLALGLGLTSAVMSFAYALFLRPLPVDDPARVVFVEPSSARVKICSHYAKLPKLKEFNGTCFEHLNGQDGPSSIGLYH